MTTAPAPGNSQPRVPTMRLMWTLFRYRPWLFALNLLLWIAFHSLPITFAYYASQLFERLGENALQAAWLMLALFGLARLGRFVAFSFAFRAWISLWYMLDALVRRNLLAYLLTARRARRLPDTPAEVVSRFRDDVNEVALYTEAFIDAGGLLVYAVVAAILMWRVDPLITVVVVTPMLLMVLLVRKLSPTIRTYRRRSREATARVTDFIGETFAAVSTIKLADREHRMVDHLGALGETRRTSALGDVLLTELIKSVNTNMVTIATGLVLLLAAAQFRTGTFGVGDFVLFAALLPRLANSMSFFGSMLAQHRRTGVSFERMTRLLHDTEPDTIVAHHPLHLRGDLPEPPNPPEREELRELHARNLTATYPGGRGVHNVNLTIRHGEFVVITGRIGAGKTTLLRALLGLIPATGTITWNGRPVEDPASFFVPPRSSYTSQIPQLFSETLQDNVLQGAGPDRLDHAIDTSVLRPDLAQLGSGLNTTVGARGVKLSGGQISRSAAARMFARDAELLVFDDLSSALDAQTERQLWENVFQRGKVTCLVVAHRRAALLRADRILVLKDGHVIDEGKLGELLERSREMRELWAEEDQD